MKRCPKLCDGGHPCVNDSRPHYYHRCNDLSCVCHARDVPVEQPLRVRTTPSLHSLSNGTINLFELVWNIRNSPRRWDTKGALRWLTLDVHRS